MKTARLTTLALLTAAPSVAALADETTLEEVVVTANKREERLIEVPMSITAISGTELEQRGFVNVQDLAFSVPGMAMREDGPGSYTIFMRGLSNQYGTGALVGVYLDEAPLSLTGFDQLDGRMYDMERVEVLKGPQGTLYGQGAVAGAIRYISRAPVLDKFEGSLQGSEAFVDGGDSKQTFTGMVNVPVVDNVFGVRLAGTWENGGGWQDQPAAGIHNGNYQDLRNVRLQALWKPTDALDVKVLGAIHRNASKLGLGFENPDRTVPVQVDSSRVLVPKKFDYDLMNLDVKYDFGVARLISASTYIDHHHQFPFSYIGGPATIYAGALAGTDARYEIANQFSQELRFASKGDGAWTWTVGAFYRRLNNQLFAQYDTLFAGTLFPDLEYFSKEFYESRSFFGDVSYELTPRLSLGVGVRYFTEDQTTQTTRDGSDLEKDSFNSTDPRVYASFKLTDDVNLYASVAKGFRSGGFNYGPLPNYEPESLVSYEIGTKGMTADKALQFEVAAYYSDYQDMLRRGLVYVGSTSTLESLTSNVGTAHIKGVEGGMTWKAMRALTLNTTASFIDSKITKVNATDATNIAGDRIDYVPRFAYTLGANYGFNWAAEVPGYFRLDYSWRAKVNYTDRTSFPAANVPQKSDAIGLLDGRLGLDYKSTSFELYGTNLTNENKWIDPYYAWGNANRTRPRTVGVQVGIRFD